MAESSVDKGGQHSPLFFDVVVNSVLDALSSQASHVMAILQSESDIFKIRMHDRNGQRRR
jgi:hypothetical protein